MAVDYGVCHWEQTYTVYIFPTAAVCAFLATAEDSVAHDTNRAHAHAQTTINLNLLHAKEIKMIDTRVRIAKWPWAVGPFVCVLLHSLLNLSVRCRFVFALGHRIYTSNLKVQSHRNEKTYYRNKVQCHPGRTGWGEVEEDFGSASLKSSNTAVAGAKSCLK